MPNLSKTRHSLAVDRGIKFMKKRLLITSIVMMLVVAVALSTATYAWFTSNDTVSATTVSFTAATSEADSIAIAWTGNSAPGTTLSAATAGTTMQPMVPVAPTIGTTTSTAFAASFTTGTLYSNAGVPTFNVADSYTGTPVIWETTNNGASPSPASASSFYIKNMSLANDVTNIVVTATITDVDASDSIAADELVRIAVFTRDLGTGGTTASTGNYLLRGILAKTAGYAATGTVSGGTLQSAISTSTTATVAAATGFNICKIADLDQSLKANNQVDVVVIVWMDGEALTDSTAGVEASIALTFAAA